MQRVLPAVLSLTYPVTERGDSQRTGAAVQRAAAGLPPPHSGHYHSRRLGKLVGTTHSVYHSSMGDEAKTESH